MFASKINVQHNVEQLRTAALKKQLSIADLLEIVEQQQQTNDKQQQTIHRLQTEVQRLRKRLAQYEPEVAGAATSHDASGRDL